MKVLYITGWCRSGSTVLGNVLAEAPGVVHVGELRFLWRNGVLGTGSNARCGCGLNHRECPVWSRVLEAVRPDGVSLERHAAQVVAWQDTNRTRHTWRTLRTSARDAARDGQRGGQRDGWPATLAATYRAIAEVCDAHTVVDSSKYASDAALLSAMPGIDASYVHLIRDPRAVAWSWLQPKDYTGRRSALDSTLNWAGFNLAAEAVGRAHRADALHLRYEDLVRSPRAAVGDILRLIGHPGPNPVAADGTVELGGNHTVTGNPNRFGRGRTVIREDRRWHTGLPRPQRAATTLLALPLLRRYGYETRV
ncbi:sulfotransferase family protein [Actinomadura logoneensis]|uniref:Sulfotransferase family protein n=1 Tax=Actinomadura logoneensis TaxID=2293572 RepID=A0A372JJ68_9ACTN|nr:sulfotransferase [Actinomadura logoneensis]RFU39904.1 sulfotransferase family protein [Actinomadura logoneensis]